jgi:RHS repeat-associated protein
VTSPGRGSVTISGTLQVTTEEQCLEFPPFTCTPVIVDRDTGTVTITVNGVGKTVNYGTGSTAANVASALATAITNDAAYPAYASVSGTTVNLTAKVANASSNYSLSASSATNKPQLYPGPSFTGTPSGPNLTGGLNASGPDTASLATPMTTTYTYDVLDNLIGVNQGAMGPVSGQELPGQVRTYVYDSLSRLTQATTPESGTVNYTYKDFGAVWTRTDARGVVTTYSYDTINRLTGVSYNVGATGVPDPPDVVMAYGTSAAAYEKGRLKSVTSGSGASEIKETFTYDKMGQVTSVTKKLDNVNYVIGYQYANDGSLTAITYPSGRVVGQEYDPIGRLKKITSATVPLLTVPTPDTNYNPAGQLLAFAYGNGVQASFSYNDRLQLATLRYDDPNSATDVLNLAYDYGTQNNGQIRAVRHYSSPGTEVLTRSQNYEYDAWHRLRRAWTTDLASANTWRFEWDYDRFGNRKNQALTGGNGNWPITNLTISESTNRVTGTGITHDNAGNMTADGINTFKYDAENRLTQVGNIVATYTYGSGPLRVKKVVGATTTRYIYSGSKIIAEYLNGAAVASPTKEYVYAGNQLLATHADGATTYHHSDHLSIRADSNSAGSPVRTAGHLPFGENWYETGGSSKWRFTSYERDPATEGGLDQAVFRYYKNGWGRFTGADPLAGNLLRPQTLNRYAYVINDPLGFSDPLGLSHHCTPGTPGYPEDCPRDDDHGEGDGPGNSGVDASQGTCPSGIRIDGVCLPRGPGLMVDGTSVILVILDDCFDPNSGVRLVDYTIRNKDGSDVGEKRYDIWEQHTNMSLGGKWGQSKNVPDNLFQDQIAPWSFGNPEGVVSSQRYFVVAPAGAAMGHANIVPISSEDGETGLVEGIWMRQNTKDMRKNEVMINGRKAPRDCPGKYGQKR